MRILLLLSALLSALTGAVAGACPLAAPVARHARAAAVDGQRNAAVMAAAEGGHRHLLGAFGTPAVGTMASAVSAMQGVPTPPLYLGRLRA